MQFDLKYPYKIDIIIGFRQILDITATFDEYFLSF